jgi:hypothetical protein
MTTPVAAAPNSMAVRLRAVPSPPIEPGDVNTPRIRLPGYPAAQPPVSVAAGAVTQAAYYSADVQTVPITPLAANGYQPTVASINTGDGFRPRGSMR